MDTKLSNTILYVTPEVSDNFFPKGCEFHCGSPQQHGVDEVGYMVAGEKGRGLFCSYCDRKRCLNRLQEQKYELK